jgi:hypothetical protein
LVEAKRNGMRASGELAFLNDWEYQLGSDILTPFGRNQLFNLGAKFRIQYGHLLTDMHKPPVFRSTTQDRMVKSALNFAAGFWGLPFEEQYHQFYLIEARGFNNTLCCDTNCPNAFKPMAWTGYQAFANFTDVSMRGTAARLQSMVEGLELTSHHAMTMVSLCAYETVALGYSAFCPLFDDNDFESFEYALDLMFHYSHAWGSPLTATLGMGWVEELVSRLTQERIYASSSTVNSSVTSDPDLFPLDQSIYVDASHDTTMTASACLRKYRKAWLIARTVLVALNLSSLSTEPLPIDRILPNRTFEVSKIAPFAANLVVQVAESTDRVKHVRFILNDGVVPATGIEGCPYDRNGFCPLETFVKAMRKQFATTEYAYVCYAD